MAKGAVGAARIEMTVNSAEFERQMKRAEDATSRYRRSLKNAERQFKKMGGKMERLGGKMSRSLTLPLASAGVAVVKAAGDFEQSFADIEKTVSATPEQFARISQEMRAMAKEIPTSVNELNRMAGVAGQLGVNAENITEFTKVIAMLGDTTDIAGEQAALSLSRFMNVMGTAQGDIDRIGATVVGLGNNFAAMESEIVNIATSMAPLGNSIGLTEQQVLAFSTAIAASGGEVQAASTAFQKAGNTMQQAVIEGNENLRIFAETAGVSAAKFQQHFQEDAAGALQLFMRGLQRVQEEGGSMVSVLDKIGLADQRLIREFGKVIGNLDQLDAALGQANTEWQRNTALTEEAQKRYQTFNSRLSILWNRIIDFSITLGNALIPTINKLINATSKLTDWFGSLNQTTIKIGVAITAFVAAIGPAVWVIGSISTAAGTLAAALGALMSPVGLVAAGIGGLILVGTNLVNNWESFAIDMGDIWKKIKKSTGRAFKNIKLIVKNALAGLSEFWDRFGGAIVLAFEQIWNTISNIFIVAFESLNIILTVASGTWLTNWDQFVEEIGLSWNNIFDAIEDNFLNFLDRTTSILISMGGKVGATVGDGVLSAMVALGVIPETFEGSVSDAVDAYGKKFNDTMNKGEKKAASMADAVSEIGRRIEKLSLPGFSIFKTPSPSEGDKNIPQKAQLGNQSIQAKTFRASMEITPPDVRPVTGAFATINEILSRFSKKSREVSEEFANSVTPMIATAVSDMAESFIAGIAKMAVEGGSLQNIFHSVMGVLADLAIRVGKIAIGIGIAIEGIKKALQSLNPVAAIAAGIGLIALGSAVRSALSNAANDAGRANSETSVNDALIRSDGSVVRFHPDDDILAMQDFGNLFSHGAHQPAPAGGREPMTAQVNVYLDSRKVSSRLEKLHTKRSF